MVPKTEGVDMDDHFRSVELKIGIDEFHTLPRNAAYKYEYFGGRAVLTPRPKCFTCVRDLSPVETEGDPWVQDCVVKRLCREEAPELSELFHGSMLRTQPFASLEPEAARKAAQACFTKTITGGDGPLIEAACFQIADSRRDGPCGATLVTLQPFEILTDPFGATWRGAIPDNAVQSKLGVPHLTWIFVSPWQARHGLGTRLLAATVEALREMGFDSLASTFMLDNGPSALFHWRNGFQLPSQMAAFRREWHKRHLEPSGS